MSCLHQDVESLFSDLIHSLEGTFSLAEIMEVRSFLDYGEYGLALESLIGIIVEENKLIASNIYDAIEKLSSMMDIDNAAMRTSLRERVIFS